MSVDSVAPMFVCPMMCVDAPQLLAAADDLGVNRRSGTLRNGVIVTAAQLRTAGEILRDGPQPVCNGIKDNMPGFIDRGATKCERLNTFLTLLHGETRCEREKDHAGPHIASVEGCSASWPNEKDAAVKERSA